MTVSPAQAYCEHGYCETEHCRTCEIMGVCKACDKTKFRGSGETGAASKTESDSPQPTNRREKTMRETIVRALWAMADCLEVVRDGLIVAASKTVRS